MEVGGADNKITCRAILCSRGSLKKGYSDISGIQQNTLVTLVRIRLFSVLNAFQLVIWLHEELDYLGNDIVNFRHWSLRRNGNNCQLVYRTEHTDSNAITIRILPEQSIAPCAENRTEANFHHN